MHFKKQKRFKKKKFSKKNHLVEYNSFYTFNILLYYLINYFKINENYKIKCFYNFYVIKHGLKNQFFKYIFIKTMFKLSLGISKYYKFLKCEEIVVPIFDEIKYSNQIKKITKVKNKNKLIV